MRTLRTYLASTILLCAGLLLFISTPSNAQDQAFPVGVHWNAPDSWGEQVSELALFEETGIKFIELIHPVNTALLDSLQKYNFSILIRTDKEYMTRTAISGNLDDLIYEYKNLIERYKNYDFVNAFGLYAHSQSFNEEYQGLFKVVVDSLKNHTNADLYEVNTGDFNALDFAFTQINHYSTPVTSGYYYFSKEYFRNDISAFNRLMAEVPPGIMIDSEWLKTAVDDYPPLKTALSERTEDGMFVLPVPQAIEEGFDFNWVVFVFILIWISMGVHIRISPMYRDLMFRYFTAKRFFVDDVMRYRERALASGIFLFVQHAMFSGIVFYCFAKACFSETGLDALFHYLPQLGITGQNYFSIFVVGFLLTAIMMSIGIAWLYFPSKSMRHMSQVFSLYTWVFHLDFLLVSLMLILLLTGASEVTILVLSILFVLIWLSGFVLTAIDSSKYLQKGRISYLFYTIGIHALINILMIIWALSSGLFIDVLELVTLL